MIKHEYNNEYAVREVVDFVVSGGGMEYTKAKMLEYRDQALLDLYTFPDSDARRAMEGLVQYTINRTK